jgi:transposase
MASLQAVRVKGHTYWRIVESRRVNGKPRPVPVLYLGKADDLLARLRAADSVKIRSLAHGHVAALYSLAIELDIAGSIDRALASSGRRSRSPHPGSPALPPLSADGLSVGESLTLAAIGRACRPTSKRGFAKWARKTTLGELAGIDVSRLSSQHFWDQMDQVPVETIPLIERDVICRVLDRFALTFDTLLFDTTNFFTFIASTNKKAELPARGHQKQKRDDLRQVGVALLCSGRAGIPLWHCTYGGSVSDARCFADVLPLLHARLRELDRDPDCFTVVYDKGNVSHSNQAVVDQAKLHYVTALTAASQRDLVNEANAQLTPVIVDGTEIPAYRTRRSIWGQERTAVVLVSKRLQDGQARGVLQHVASASKWLDELAAVLAARTQRRDRARIQRDIEARLKGRQFLARVLNFRLTGKDPDLSLSYQFDTAAFEALRDQKFGRVVLITDRHDWPTPDIIRAYHSQAHIEAVFKSWKDPLHVSMRPQYHWTDQKIHVHVLICVLSYLLARLLLLRAQRLDPSLDSVREVIGRLALVRRATVARPNERGKWSITSQLEEMDDNPAKLWRALGLTS